MGTRTKKVSFGLPRKTVRFVPIDTKRNDALKVGVFSNLRGRSADREEWHLSNRGFTRILADQKEENSAQIRVHRRKSAVHPVFAFALSRFKRKA
jgi:hypothetical protein